MDAQRDEAEYGQDRERGEQEEVVGQVAVVDERNRHRDQERGGEAPQGHAPDGAHRARIGVDVLPNSTDDATAVAMEGPRREAFAAEILEVLLDEHAFTLPGP